MARAARRALTAAVEYGVGRAGIAVVRVLDRDVIGQGHQPRGAAGSVTGWVFAHRPSNRQRNRWAVSLLDVQPTSQLLEIGFGPGIVTTAPSYPNRPCRSHRQPAQVSGRCPGGPARGGDQSPRQGHAGAGRSAAPARARRRRAAAGTAAG